MVKTQYYIDLDAPNTPPGEEVLRKLFEHRFVFSSNRCKNLNEVKSMWPSWSAWRCLVFNEEEECCMIVHANDYLPAYRDLVNIMTLDEILQLPEFK